jgi:uncharacterized protein YaaW (UPF0174 family)
MDLVVPRDRDLPDLLSRASSGDLNVLADLITDFGKGRFALDGSVKSQILACKERGRLQDISELLAGEISAFGGNTLVNAVRKGGVSYQELASDVAKQLGGKPSSGLAPWNLEEIALTQAVKKAFKDVTVDVSNKSGAQLADLMRPTIDGMIKEAGSALGAIANSGASGIMGLLGVRAAPFVLAPLAAAAAGVTAAQATTPAYRITTPAVLQIAIIRRRQFDSDLASYREALQACK